MQIANDTVVSMDYTLTDDDGQVIDSSEGREPLAYLHGHNNIIPGLEEGIVGKRAGDELQVTVAPEEGYGLYQDALVQEVPREAFAGMDPIEPGMSFRADSSTGPLVVVVLEVNEDTVTVDGNHMLAGKTLHFSVAIREVRAATEEELAQGTVSA